MDVKEVLSMKRGENSYVQYSLLTQKVTSITKPVLENAAQSLFSKSFHLNGVFNVADLGCAAGPNSFSVISTVKECVAKNCKELNCQTPELQVYFNDLPGNDFNTLFKGLLEFGGGGDRCDGVSCYVMGVPGSFHSRLFPRNHLHLVHSSYSVQWQSQAPKGLSSREGLALNKGKIYISMTSPPVVREAYLSQFHQDFTNFLNSRSQEVVWNGCMVLILHGRQCPDPSDMESCFTWELLAKAISELVSQGVIDEVKLDSFNVPYYIPSAKEVQDVVERQGSFKIENIDTIAVNNVGKGLDNGDVWVRGEIFGKRVRVFTESMISNQFGEEVLDKIYEKFTRIAVSDWVGTQSTGAITIVAVLNKITG
ncbi:hypothetical protein ACSBR1_007803 [Camellia fascicularis]